MVNDILVQRPQNAKMNGKTLGSNPIHDLVGSLVAVLGDREAECKCCKESSKIRHFHYFVDDGSILDPSIELPPMEELVCNSCSSGSGLKRCTACSNVYYCSRKCQVKDWPLHARKCVVTTKSPPPPASFPPSANVTPVVVTSRLTSSPANGKLEPIHGPLNGSGDVVDAATTPVLTQQARRDMSAEVERARLLEAKKKAENERIAAEKKAEEARMAQLAEKKRKDEEQKVLAEKMEALKIQREKEELAEKKRMAELEAAKAKAAESKASAVPKSNVVTLELGKKYTAMVVWKVEEEKNVFRIAPDENVMYTTILAHTELCGALPNIEVKVGDYCVARSVDDNEFYRARVMKINGDTCEVYFIDYGNTNTIPVDGIKGLKSPITIEETPEQAVKVTPDDVMKMDLHYNSGEPLAIIPLSVDAKGTYTVKVAA